VKGFKAADIRMSTHPKHRDCFGTQVPRNDAHEASFRASSLVLILSPSPLCHCEPLSPCHCERSEAISPPLRAGSRVARQCPVKGSKAANIRMSTHPKHRDCFGTQVPRNDVGEASFRAPSLVVILSPFPPVIASGAKQSHLRSGQAPAWQSLCGKAMPCESAQGCRH